MGADDEQILKTWSAGRYYTKLKWLAWNAYTRKKYSEIMADKNK